MFVYYKRKLSSLGKFTNFSCISVRLRKLLYVKSWIGHWAVLRSLWRNYSNVTAVIDWNFSQVRQLFLYIRRRDQYADEMVENAIIDNDRYIHFIVTLIFFLYRFSHTVTRFSVNVVEMIVMNHYSHYYRNIL